jgi:hypothetical protein
MHNFMSKYKYNITHLFFIRIIIFHKFFSNEIVLTFILTFISVDQHFSYFKSIKIT